MKDLFILVADKNAEFTLNGALSRPEALGIRPVEFTIRPHPGRDGGARRSGPEVLAIERTRHRHGLLVLDYEGSGTRHANALELETELNARLDDMWDGKARSIVIEPELDTWIWGSDNAIEPVVEWNSTTRIREWLKANGFQLDNSDKPLRPKEAIESVLRKTNMPRSSALYMRIASRVSLARCRDAAFTRLRSQLAAWFPPR